MGSQALALAFPRSTSTAGRGGRATEEPELGPATDLLSADERAAVARALASNIAAHGYHPYSGELSLTYLFDGLQGHGRPDIAVAMASNPSQPGWGFMVESGATTMCDAGVLYARQAGYSSLRKPRTYGPGHACWYLYDGRVLFWTRKFEPKPPPRPPARRLCVGSGTRAGTRIATRRSARGSTTCSNLGQQQQRHPPTHDMMIRVRVVMS